MKRAQVIEVNGGGHVVAVPDPLGGYEIRTSEGELIGRASKTTVDRRTIWDYSTAADDGEWGHGEAPSLWLACQALVNRRKAVGNG